MLVFCSLFDSNYIDKGIVMYRSLVNTGCDFKMYILALDKKCKQILDAYQYPNLFTIDVETFSADQGLAEIRKTRSIGDFCFTCTAFLIDYVLVKYSEPICTYVDADLFFYYDPKFLIDSMNNKTVQIVEHRFNPTVSGRLLRVAGTYCVEFNTFKNTPDSLELLNWWKNKCYEACTISAGKKGVWGDQGYLEDWGSKPNVHVLEYLGGGMAPWNVVQYRLLSNDKEITLEEKRTGNTFFLVFYHFQYITYRSAHEVNIHISEPWREDRKLIELLYINYLKELDSAKNELKEKFGLYPLLTKHPALKEKKKTIRDRLQSLDSLLFLRIINKIANARNWKKYAYLNEISFDNGN